MKKFKRNAVVLTVLLFVCAAVYLNWSYNKNEREAAADRNDIGTEVGQILDDTALQAEAVQDAVLPEGSEDAGLYYTDAADAEVDSDYFDSVRLTRSQARDAAVATLSQVSESATASQEDIDAAMDGITQIADDALLEAQMESLIMAKGFEQCVVYISEDGISVAVPAPGEGLAPTEVARITDVVTAETSFIAEDLKIIEVK